MISLVFRLSHPLSFIPASSHTLCCALRRGMGNAKTSTPIVDNTHILQYTDNDFMTVVEARGEPGRETDK